MSTLIFYRYVIQNHQINYGTPKSHYIRFEITPRNEWEKKEMSLKTNIPINTASNRILFYKNAIKNGIIPCLKLPIYTLLFI